MNPSSTPDTYHALFLVFGAIAFLVVVGVFLIGLKALKTEKELEELKAKTREKKPGVDVEVSG